MTGRALALTATLLLTACGVLTPAERPGAAPAVTTTVPVTVATVDPDAPLPEVLDAIGTLMFDLDTRIADKDRAGEVLADIEILWEAAERQIRADDPDEVFNFSQAIDLARSGVERRRPADASKGWKIWQMVVAAYLDR